MYEIGLTHTIDAAHRVVGHEGGRGKCARLHGHTYRFEVELAAENLDETGFILDYGVIKRLLDEWDHRTLLWEQDPLGLVPMAPPDDAANESVVRLPFNPTAENLARHAAERIARLAVDLNPRVYRVTVVCCETPKSRATWTEVTDTYSRKPGRFAV